MNVYKLRGKKGINAAIKCNDPVFKNYHFIDRLRFPCVAKRQLFYNILISQICKY